MQGKSQGLRKLSVSRRAIIVLVLLAVAVFLVWRLVRPMNIFVVEDRFAWPIDTRQPPPVLGSLSSRECAACHQAFYDEWRSSIHSQAWSDPYFQTDWQFEDAQHSCRLCHTPLDRQQPHKVLGYRDKDKWDPILEDNPDFDLQLQHEGVTCAACHYREGKIVGVFGDTDAPHPVEKLRDPDQICVRCHVVEGERWDTFFRFPPCGTVAEIASTRAERPGPDVITTGTSGEVTADDAAVLGCVQCHMPLANRPLAEGGVVRVTRQHLWRGGHDPAMVKKALTVEFAEADQSRRDTRVFILTLTNTGAAHYVPTGTPDRHLTVQLRLLDERGGVLDEQFHTIKRTLMWRPFIVDLWDTRLARWQPRRYELEVAVDSRAAKVEAEISYHLLAEKRRKRIGYENKTPINYVVFRKQIPLRAVLEGGADE
jgi:hypothetical protein